MKGDPMGVERDELVIYLLGLCVVSGLTTIFGVGASNAVNEATPDWVEIAWGVMLLFGGAATLTGMFWQYDVRDGLLMKRAGMLSLSVAAFLFGIVVIVSVGIGGMLTGGIILGFSYACFKRYRRINKRIRQIIEASPTGTP